MRKQDKNKTKNKSTKKNKKKNSDNHISSVLLEAVAYSQSSLGNLPFDEAPLQLNTPPRNASNERHPVQQSTPSSAGHQSMLDEIQPAELSLVSLNSSDLSHQGEKSQ